MSTLSYNRSGTLLPSSGQAKLGLFDLQSVTRVLQFTQEPTLTEHVYHEKLEGEKKENTTPRDGMTPYVDAGARSCSGNINRKTYKAVAGHSAIYCIEDMIRPGMLGLLH